MNHHAVEKPSVTAQYTKTAEKPDLKRCSDLSGIEKVHRNSIKITVDLWWTYGGDEGSRTPVQKACPINLSECSSLF